MLCIRNPLAFSAPKHPLETNCFSYWQAIHHIDFQTMSGSEQLGSRKKKPSLTDWMYFCDHLVHMLWRYTVCHWWQCRPPHSPSPHYHSLAPQIRLCGPIMMCDLSRQSQHRKVILEWECKPGTAHNMCSVCLLKHQQWDFESTWAFAWKWSLPHLGGFFLSFFPSSNTVTVQCRHVEKLVNRWHVAATLQHRHPSCVISDTLKQYLTFIGLFFLFTFLHTYLNHWYCLPQVSLIPNLLST